MDDFQRELNELKGFIADLKTDRAATKEKEKREAWTKYVSLTVVIMAVVAAIASQWSGKYGSRVLTQLNDATFNQTRASDQWAYYQAKSIKLKNYQLTRDQTILGGEAAGARADLIKKYDAEIDKYKGEQEAISNKASTFELQRDTARKEARLASEKGGKMGMAVSFYSVAIAIASICMVTKRKPLWFLAMGLALAGVYQMVIAWIINQV